MYWKDFVQKYIFSSGINVAAERKFRRNGCYAIVANARVAEHGTTYNWEVSPSRCQSRIQIF